MIDLNGKTALITGASKGIGLATAEILAKHGANVVLVARSKNAIEQHAAKLNESGYTADALVCDVTDYAKVSYAVQHCVEKFDGLDILINNAGSIDPIAFIADSNPEIWSATIDVNIKGVYYGMRAAIPIMKTQGQGTIINMSSGAANSALEGWSHYCSSKAAAQRLTEIAHKEEGDHGINIIGLSPGTVATDMMKKIKESGINPVSQLEWSSHISPEWVAKAVLFLCGPEGHEFSGTDFSIKTQEGRDRVGLV